MRRAAALAAAAATATALAAPAAAPGATVRLPFPQDDGSLTPTTFTLGYGLMTLVYDTLTWRDAAGVPRPWLARSVERSAGGRRVAIRLRGGARWHDGRPLTARDVAFTFRFFARRPHPRFTPQLRSVSRIEVSGPRALTLTLRHPALGFDDQPLADVPILPRHLWRGLPRDRLAPPGLPVGSGPYRLVAHRPGRGYRFEAHDDYFRGRPAVQRVDVPVIRTADATLRALQGRRVDMVPAPLGERDQDRLESLGIRVRRGPAYLGTALLLNTRQAPFDRLAARRALAAALDPARIAAAVGRATPAATGFLHPRSRWAPRRPLATMPAPAGAAPRLPSLRVLALAADPVKREAGRQVVLALRRAGLRAELVELPRAALDRALGRAGTAPSFQAAVDSTPALVSHDPDFLWALFGREAPLNATGYRTAAFERLAARTRRAATTEARRRAVAAQLRRLAEDAPAVPLLFAEGAFAYRPAVHDGWVFVRGSGLLDKRSFAAAPPAPASPVPGEALDREGEDGPPLGLVALILLGLAAALALVLGLRGRR